MRRLERDPRELPESSHDDLGRRQLHEVMHHGTPREACNGAVTMSGFGETWTLRRVLTKILEEDLTGVLDVVSAGVTTRIHVRKGNVVRVERVGQETRSHLADYLIETGRMTIRDIVEARQKSTALDMQLDEYLVSRRLASEDQAKRHADLNCRDLIFSLFTLESMNVGFKDERPRPSSYATQLPISFVLKEAERRNAEWPELRRRVGSVHAVYEKDSSVVGQILGYVALDPEASEAVSELSGSARVVIFHANGKKTVEQLGRATGLGLFETYRGLRELLDADLVMLKAHEGVGEQPAAHGSRLSRVFSTVVVAAVITLIGLGLYWGFNQPELFRLQAPTVSDAHASEAAQAHVVNVRTALEIHHVRHRKYPEALSALADGFGLGPATLRAMTIMAYSTTPHGYTLAHPASGHAKATGEGPPHSNAEPQ